MGGGVRLKAWLIGPRPIGWRHWGLQNTWNFGAGDVEGSAANGLFLQREMGGSLQRRGKRLAFEDMFAFTRVSRVSVCVCVREGAACMVHTGPGGRQHAPSASQASSLALIKAQARLCRSQRGRFNHRFTSSFSPIWRPLLLSDTFFVSRLSLNSFQGGKRPRVDFSRRLQGAHEARLIIKRLLWRRRFHRLCCHTHTLQKKKKNQIRFLFSITLTCLLVHT